jgi:NADPH-dependent 2,4-dienoyl-CoA reductase/sulfur reductase-like enzyme/rhodanese-related sulfurtransferase
MTSRKVLIVGGVAGGANAATRLRRLDEDAEIVIFERGPYVSFANCGLPYHIGGEIEKREKLLQHTPETLRARFAIDVRVLNEVVSIDRTAKQVMVQDLAKNTTYQESYDTLILSPGAAPFKPTVPGLDLEGVFTLRDVPDMDRIIAWLSERQVKQVAIAGGGFIGLEMMEQLHHRQIAVTLFESNPQILTPLDKEMVAPIESEMRDNGVTLYVSDPVAKIESKGEGPLLVSSKSGVTCQAEAVIWSIGVRPETTLAVDAGLTLGTSGGIKVNQHLQTSDPDIYAVGDCIEVTHGVTHTPAVIPLAGPANRQGRIAADNIVGIRSTYKATFGTAIVRVFSQTAACTGANEKLLQKSDISYQAIHVHPASHASYYPGAHPTALKVLFCPETGKILGAQGVGKDSVDKRIDVIAVAMQAGVPVEELAELELCYAPPFGSAKDPVNMLGMVAQNIRAGRVSYKQWSDIEDLSRDSAYQILDVRDEAEVAKGAMPNSIHIPLNSLRSRLSELPKDKTLIVYCHSGQRSYNACCILAQRGFSCCNVSGAFKTWSAVP